MSQMNALSPNYDVALELAQRGDAPPEEILRMLKLAIEAGDHRAGYALGSWYLHGTNVGKDLEKAYAHFEVAAKAGNPDALYELAVFHETGEYVKKDVKKALLLYIDAALHGDAQSHYEVGRIYWHGLSGKPDKELGAVWMDRAEELGIKEDDGDTA